MEKLAALGLALAFFSQNLVAMTFETNSKYSLDLLTVGETSDRFALYGLSSLKLSTLDDADLMVAHPLYSSLMLESEINLEEETSYIDLRRFSGDMGWKDTFEIKVGQDVIIWGKGDELNPTDVINAEDYEKFIVWSKERRKIARPMGQAIFGYGGVSLTLVALPTLQRHRVPDPTVNDWCHGDCAVAEKGRVKENFKEMGLDAEIEEYDLPERDNQIQYKSRYDNLGETNEFAAKLSGQFSVVEASLIFHDGFERFPVYERQFTSETSLILSEIDARRRAFGGDIAFTLGDFVIRSEGIYKIDKAYMATPGTKLFKEDENGIVYGDEWEALVGSDYDGLWGFFISAQYFERYTKVAYDDVLKPKGNQLVSVVIQRDFFSEDLLAKYRSLIDVEEGSSAHFPSLAYKFSDYVSTRCQLNLFDGNDETLFGDYYQNNGALLALDAEF